MHLCVFMISDWYMRILYITHKWKDNSTSGLVLIYQNQATELNYDFIITIFKTAKIP